MIWFRYLRHKVQLAAGLSPSEYLMLMEAWCWLFFFYLALLVMSYERLKVKSQSFDNNFMDVSHAFLFAQRYKRIIGYAAGLHFIPMTCLIKSLALQKMLGRRNLHGQMRIGVQKTQGILYAHAWVEINGKPVGEPDDVLQKFNVLQSVSTLHHRQFI